jgi:CDP-glucose 4,6-dehydratase
VNRSVRARPLRDLTADLLYKRRIVVTGHTGFVGSWLATSLAEIGSEVTGFSLPSDVDRTTSGLPVDHRVADARGDIRDREALSSLMRDANPEVVFHLAAQALVLPSYVDPITTLETNILGTAQILDVMRTLPSVRAAVVVTSDKCYATRDRAHDEDDPLGGDDPYSASKGAAEIVTAAYRHSYFNKLGVGLATARAGNIIGGGDESEFRIVPDCIRAFQSGKALELRHPDAIRPWQHVLDAVNGYVRIACALLEDPNPSARAWNFGPLRDDAIPVRELARRMAAAWCILSSGAVEPAVLEDAGVPERATLMLDSSRARTELGWDPVLDLDSAIRWSVEWYFASAVRGANPDELTVEQIQRYLAAEEESKRLREVTKSGYEKFARRI